jgi:hypothetical protein
VYRSHRQRLRAKREHEFHLRWVHRWPEELVQCECEFQVGRFRKRKALDCGRPRCQLCGFHKVFSIPSHQDRIRELRFQDSLADVLEPGES